MNVRPRSVTKYASFLSGVLGVVLLGLAVMAVAYPVWWTHHSRVVGRVLLERSGADGPTRLTRGSAGSACTSGGWLPTSHRPGVVEIPAIGLSAPVLAGISNAVLAVSVGHDPMTVWPGSPGESVLLGHDVSYFSHLDRVRVGDTVNWTLGCRRAVFRVTAITVAKPGAHIRVPPSGSGLALVTCWPSNALFWTPDRFVVEATLVATEGLAHAPHVFPPVLVRLRVPAPAALRAKGLSLTQSGIFVGHMAIAGTPARTFQQGPQPLSIAASVLREYAAAAKTAAAGNSAWWSAIALRGVPLPHAWAVSYVTDVTLIVAGHAVSGAVVSSAAATITLVDRRGVLFVSHVTIRVPASLP